MAHLQYGPLCPDGHGVMVERDDWSRMGVLWCSHSQHGGNGRFYRNAEVMHGTYNPTVKSTAVAEYEIKVATVAAVNEELRKVKMTEPKTTKPAKTRKAKEPRECKCGCGEMTKGGLFRPGHDARYHAALAKAQGAQIEDF
jgi:hypothetical protein